MRRLALLLEYDGSAFSGSQYQPGRRTVQGVIEEAARALTGQPVRVAFAGRTDAGVHARGQVAAFDTESALEAAVFRRGLNHYLPEDVAVLAVAEVAADFDPRRHALGRVYRYRIDDGGVRSPLRRRIAWHREAELDADAMARAASLLPREPRDWAAFGGPVPPGYPTVRTLRRCEVRRCAPHRLTVTMEADGFLPHQVRRTVGALERVGAGRSMPEEFAALVEGAPSSVGPAAPPRGLVLCAVQYAPGTVCWSR